jgi:hypothetical protein
LCRMTCSAVLSMLIAVGWGSSTPAKVKRYRLSRCKSAKREMERSSLGSGVGK